MGKLGSKNRTTGDIAELDGYARFRDAMEKAAPESDAV